MVRRSLKRERAVVVSSSEEGSSDTPPAKKVSMDAAGTPTAPEAVEKGKRKKEISEDEGPQGIASMVDKTLTIFGVGAKRFARPGFLFRRPEAIDRICLPRSREVGFYIPCVMEMGLRFPIPAFFAVILHFAGIPLYMLTANSTANMVGFLVACGRLQLGLMIDVFRYFFHIVLNNEGYYVIQARRNRKLILDLNRKVKDWKENFAFVVYPEEAVMPGPLVLDLENGGLEWLNEDPKDSLSDTARNAVISLGDLSEDERKFESLATSHNISKFAWDKDPLMASQLEKLLNKVAASRQKESEERIAKARSGAQGGRATGVTIQSRPQAKPVAPEGAPSAAPTLRKSVTPSVHTPVETLERGMAPPQPTVAELRVPVQVSLPRPSSPRESRKRGREEETDVAEGGASPAGSAGGLPVNPATPLAGAGTVAGVPLSSGGPTPSVSLMQLFTAHAEGVSKGVESIVDSIFEEQDAGYAASSKQAKKRVMDKTLKLAQLCTQYKVEAETGKKKAEGALERLRAVRAEMRNSPIAEVQRRLEAAEAKEKETMALLKTSDAAKDRAVGELKKAQVALDAVQTELAKEKKGRAAVEADLVETNLQLTAQRGTIGLRDKRVAELEGILQHQTTRVQELEERMAKAQELDAETLEQARLKAIEDFMEREVRGMFGTAMDTGAEQGRKEGFEVGFYQAKKMIGAARPELLPELGRFTVERARIEMDAALAAEVQAQLEMVGGRPEVAVSGKGKEVKDSA